MENQGLVLCSHCDKFLPARTVQHHKSGLKRKRLEQSIDARRVARCIDSSDEDEKDNTDTSHHESSMHTENEYSSDPEHISDDEVAEVWENENEDELNNDIEDNYQSVNKQQNEKDQASSIVKWILCSVLYLQTFYKLSSNCVQHFLILLNQIFTVLGNCSSLCASVAKLLPKSVYLLRKLTSFDRDNFKKYIVCPNCMALYNYGDIVCQVNNRTIIRKCTNKVFGCRVDITSRNRGKKGKFQCNAALVKEIQLPNGKKYYPLKVFCYKHVIDSLEQFLKCQDFQKKCNMWRERKPAADTYGDIFDGNVWKGFEKYKNRPFLSDPNNFGVMLNVDWFQPFTRRRDVSVGVMYLVFMNLPRHLRFKAENIILLGIIPALNKEPESLNSFLTPLVDELKILENGIELFPHGHGNPVKCRVLLMCAASDIPAARKLCGFMGHSATHGCSFCSIKFVDEAGHRYCGGSNQQPSEKRTRQEHLKYGQIAERASTLTQKKDIERSHGYRYTKLLDLEYFQPSTFCVVEPMHNLFLGTAKRLFGHWVDNDILSKSDLNTLRDNISSMNVSSDVGRLPSNISSNFGQFTADEWKNWVLVYSLFALHNVLPARYLKNWQTFVLACNHVCRPMVKKTNIQIAHQLLLKFCREAEDIYGAKFITPNMHLHTHLRECIQNFGSIYGFWAFSFERYNGLLAEFPNNKRSIEIQLMRKFQEVEFASSLKSLDFGEHQELFAILTGCSKNQNRASEELQLAQDLPLHEIKKTLWCDVSALNIKADSYKLVNLSSTCKSNLCKMYRELYGNCLTENDLGTVAKKFSNLQWDMKHYSSESSPRGDSCKIVQGKWASDTTNVDCDGEMRPGVVQYYIKHVIDVDGILKEHILAVMNWYKRPREDHHLNILPPATVWSTKLQNDGPASFIPIQRLSSRCGWATVKQDIQKYLVVCPLPQHVFM